MNKTSRFVLLAFFPILLTLPLAGQKKIVILGSSTAAGNGASSYANSWAGKITAFYNQNASDGLDTIVYNLAVGGYSSYEEMPTGNVPPANRPSPDISHNVTAAMAYHPDIVIVNLPSNDITRGYRINEAMNNFRVMAAVVSAGGARFFISTAQPRNEAPAMRDSLAAFKDSIIVGFGLKYIDFWSDIVTQDGTNMIRPELNAGDGIHVNDLGHNLLYMRVRNKQIFADNLPLPLRLIEYTASLSRNAVRLNWTTASEEPDTYFIIERSVDGIHFNDLTQMRTAGGAQQKDYSWTDHAPHKGMNLYRIRIRESGRETFSKTLRVDMTLKGISVSGIRVTPTGDLSFRIFSDRQSSADIRIISSNGATLRSRSMRINEGSQPYSVPARQLPSGAYFIQIITPEGGVTTGSFIR